MKLSVPPNKRYYPEIDTAQSLRRGGLLQKLEKLWDVLAWISIVTA
nr:MAG TPA: hypothetical protein [Caudoviricetes sp.]